MVILLNTLNYIGLKMIIAEFHLTKKDKKLKNFNLTRFALVFLHFDINEVTHKLFFIFLHINVQFYNHFNK
jgi:hypothetical protein